jgi:hypothetical protein
VGDDEQLTDGGGERGPFYLGRRKAEKEGRRPRLKKEEGREEGGSKRQRERDGGRMRMNKTNNEEEMFDGES